MGTRAFMLSEETEEAAALGARPTAAREGLKALVAAGRRSALEEVTGEEKEKASEASGRAARTARESLEYIACYAVSQAALWGLLSETPSC